MLYFVFMGVTLIAWQPALAQTAASWIERGEDLERQGVYVEAVKAYTKAIELDPGCADAYLKRGVARFSAKKTSCTEALADLTEAIRRAPTNAEAYYQRGIINYYLMNNEQGLKDMEAAAGLGHPKARAWFGAQATTGNGNVSPVNPIIYFDHAKIDIRAPYRSLLEEIGAIMQRSFSSSSIVVSGHADGTGTDEYNQDLSLRRAQAVKGFLIEQAGIPSQRIIVRAYGEEMPAAPNDTEEGRAANRRVEITGIAPANAASGPRR